MESQFVRSKPASSRSATSLKPERHFVYDPPYPDPHRACRGFFCFCCHQRGICQRRCLEILRILCRVEKSRSSRPHGAGSSRSRRDNRELQDDGFTIQWITVVRGANGARTGDDVKRREVTENFIPVEDKENVFVLAPKGGLFQKSELPNPLLGDAVRWAAIDGNDMTIYSLAISETGGSELQVYRRSLTEKGMDIRFMRLQDEDVKVRMSGKLVRTQ